MRKTIGTAAVVVLVATTVAACSSSKKESSNSGAAGSGVASTDPIVIGVDYAQSATLTTVPGAVQAAQAAVDAVNAAGGIKGRKLKLVSCNDADDPNQATTCARRMVDSDKVVALTGTVTRQSASLYPVLESKGVVNFGNTVATTDDATNPLSFPIAPGGAIGISVGSLVPDSAKKVAVFASSTASGKQTYSYIEKALVARGKQSIYIPVDPAAVDFQPVLATYKQSGADMFVGGLATGQLAPLILASIRAGITTPITTNSLTISQPALDAAKGLKGGLLVSVVFQPNSPRQAQFDTEMKKYASSVSDLTVDGLKNTWLAVHVFADAAAKLDSVTPSTFHDYLSKQTALETGWTAPINYAKPGPLEGAPRTVNIQAYPGKADDGKLIQTSDSPIKLSY